MNTLEGRIRAAITQTAGEITPGSIPPLSLPGRGPRCRVARTSRPRSARWTRVIVPLTAAAAVIAMIASAVAVSMAGSPGRFGRTGGTGPLASPGGRYATRLEREALDYYLTATGAQNTTGGLYGALEKALSNNITAKCLARAGYYWAEEPVTSSRVAAYDFGYDLSQFPDLDMISRTGYLGEVPYSPGRSPHRMTGSSHPGLRAVPEPVGPAVARCSKAGEKPFARVDRFGNALGTPLTDVFDRIQASGSVRATIPGLRACAERHSGGGPDAGYMGVGDSGPASAIRSYSAFVGWVAGHIDGAGNRGASSARMNAISRHWAPIFVQCARRTVNVFERLQAADRARFIRDHEHQVLTLEVLAVQAIARAERELGMSGGQLTLLWQSRSAAGQAF